MGNYADHLTSFVEELDALVAHATLNKHDVIIALLRGASAIADRLRDEDQATSTISISAAVRSGRYVEYASAWIAKLKDPAEARARWISEKQIRNQAGVSPEDRDRLLSQMKEKAGGLVLGLNSKTIDTAPGNGNAAPGHADSGF